MGLFLFCENINNPLLSPGTKDGINRTMFNQQKRPPFGTCGRKNAIIRYTSIKQAFFIEILSGIFRPVEKSDTIPVTFHAECNHVCLSFGCPAIQS
jgi:hypothetical protein